MATYTTWPSRSGWAGLAIGGVIILALALVLIVVPAPLKPALSPAADGQLKVLSTFAPIYSFAANVAGSAARVENLLPFGVGPHSYAFKPADAAKVTSADVIFKNGRGLENWLTPLIASPVQVPNLYGASAGEAHAEVVDLTADFPALGSTDADDLSGNPHFWLSPRYAVRMVEKISRVLAQRDPSRAAIFETNAADYTGLLQQLDRDIQTQLRPVQHTPFIAFHDAFTYFNQDYGLNQISVIEAFPGKEPTPQDLARLTALIKTQSVKAIFVEPQFSPKVAASLAADTGAKVAILDPMETGQFSADFYISTMRQNVAALVSALE